MENLTTPNNLRDYGEIWYPDWNPPLNGTLSDSGTLTVTLGFLDGEQGYMRAGAASSLRANSVVPEPASAVLFITGGTLLAGRSHLKRKKRT
ncbi:MAG: hypothetical protein AABY87_08305 [bacterium]